MLINLLPDFLAVLDAEDREEAYQQYHEAHRPILDAYWHNYVLDPGSAHAQAIVANALRANRDDLRAIAASVDLVALAEEAIGRAEELLQVDRPTDCYLMVGVGGANAGELVVAGRGIAFICLEHFTGRANPETYGMGLPPDLIPLWLAHELAHTVRYTSLASQSELRRLVSDLGNYYDYWQTGSRATLRELLINEGLAVHASRVVAPAFDAADYFGYPRRQYHRLRELEAFLRRAVEPDLERSGLGLRLRYLSGGMSSAARLVSGRVIPERSGYYLGFRMAEALVAERGLANALRAPVSDFQVAEDIARGVQTA
ncbi:MAG TPA: DUF2268 domain-containing putative Zn-dependent protease [Gemmatimonadales bacterium]|nr:DUF2268 domain-containing putative Zn-dependent protease [Gemmatimonadales bacterium]